MSLHPENDETVAIGAPATPRPVTQTNAQRFAPGTLLASRYRIVSRLGKGGMGEVFRADDIMLGQPVALKFLPESARGNVNLLTRFYDEVRIARQISHPNVCRVYDIGEIEGQPYLSMEYIDGEDLSSLLRRIGRLPGDKAAEFARKMCAGLAAAHQQGVLHRDIKPGNIMIDGRGEPRITDFGLAAFGATVEGNEIRNGTPAYMAPEQMEGREVSVQSDIYALGLVFHEMFTGKAAHDGDTVAELTRIRKTSRVTNASTLVADLDPAVDRAIRACLEPDPKLRPKSALELARMLPGGDPLAAALAAGQTPSPELVAASGSVDAMRPAYAIAALVSVFVLTAAAVWYGTLHQIADRTYLEQPEVLESKARELIRNLGFPDSPVDSAAGYVFSQNHRSFLWARKLDDDGWNKALAAQPSPINYWYRQSPAPLASDDSAAGGRVTPTEPPPLTAGMLAIQIAMDGRLLSLDVVPPERSVTKDPIAYDWAPLFAAAKLDPAAFQSAPAEWTPIQAFDQRAAWTGMYPGQTDMPVRIEATAFQGRPVHFAIVWPWTRPQRTIAAEQGTAARRAVTRNVFFGFIVILTIATLVVARRNWKVGRVDLRGANQLGVFITLTNLAVWLLRAHHSSSQAEQVLLMNAFSDSIASGMQAWIAYLALEPWVRRYWPQSLVTWSRVISGRWNDPLVGRDILFAVLLGLSGVLYVGFLQSFDGVSLGDFQITELMGVRAILAVVGYDLAATFAGILMFFLTMFLLRLLLRRGWLAALAFTILWTTYRGFGSGADTAWVSMLFLLPITILIVIQMTRFGFLTTLVGAFVVDTTVDLLATPDLTAWYGQSTLIVVILVLGMACLGFRWAVGNQSIWAGGPKQE